MPTNASSPVATTAAYPGMQKVLTRRQALRALGLATFAGWLSKPLLAQALHASNTKPWVIWWNAGAAQLGLGTLQAQASPDFLSLLKVDWQSDDLDFLRPAGTKWPPQPARKPPILIIEHLPTAATWQTSQGLGLHASIRQAKAVILLGTQASFGVLSNTPQDLKALLQRCKQTKTPVIKLPGMPPPPQHLLGTITHLELLGFPKLDALRRPLLYYQRTICQDCERQGDLQRGQFAHAYGEMGCLLQLGCKGPVTHNSCAVLRWNSASNWCVGAGGPCTGCASPSWPEHAGLGLYGNIAHQGHGASSWVWKYLHQLGAGLLALGALGAGLQMLRGYFFPRLHKQQTIIRPISQAPPHATTTPNTVPSTPSTSPSQQPSSQTKQSFNPKRLSPSKPK